VYISEQFKLTEGAVVVVIAW